MLTNFKKSDFLKTISLSILFFFSFHLISYAYPAPVPNSKRGAGYNTDSGSNPFQERFERGKKLFFEKSYEKAEIVLTNLVDEFKDLKNRLRFKGNTYILLGATYEKLKKKKPAIKYFCEGKKILGMWKCNIEELKLKKFKYYKKGCDSAVIPMVGKKKKKKSIFGILLGLALLGGAAWYLFINKNSPLKKKDDEPEKPDYSDPGNWGVGFDCFKFVVTWVSKASVMCQSGSNCTVTAAFENGQLPNPSSDNNWDDTKNFIISTTGMVSSVSVTLTFKIKGCNNGVIKNTIYVDGNKVLERTDQFANGCAPPSIDASEVQQIVLTVSGTGTHTIRHVVDLSGNARKGSRCSNPKLTIRSK